MIKVSSSKAGLSYYTTLAIICKGIPSISPEAEPDISIISKRINLYPHTGIRADIPIKRNAISVK